MKLSNSLASIIKVVRIVGGLAWRRGATLSPHSRISLLTLSVNIFHGTRAHIPIEYLLSLPLQPRHPDGDRGVVLIL